jgi:hypothetical protein
MLRAGRYAVIAGIILTVLGVAIGFTALLMDADEFAKPFLAVIPVGFLMTFAGLTTVLLISESRD